MGPLLGLIAAHPSVWRVLFGATVLTTVGKGIITGRMLGSSPAQAEPKYIAWGTGAGTAVVANTTLFTEAAEARTAGTGSQVTTSTANDTHQIVGTITSLSSQTITNAGVFDASTVGNLYVKGDFTGVALAIGESIAFTVKVQLT